MLRMIVKRLTALPLLSGAVLLFAGFCLITNTVGDRRIYFNSAIPLSIRLNASTPSNYLAPIQAAAQAWNDQPGSFFEFTFGATTTTAGPGQDGVNLLFFDLAGVNFPPPTSVIAFSQTFTSSAGGYHAIESDLIWNARDFPPSPTGAPGAQDLQSVVTHEFGHHLGLDHTGLPGGASSGCGPQVQPATMWWSSANGDTTKRSLHAEDIMGVSVLYPSWRLQGTVTSGATPVNLFPIWFRGSKASTVGPVENPIGTRYNRSGYLLDTLYTDFAGQYSTVVIDQEFDIIADGFGFERDSFHVQFNPPGGIGQTQVITRNIQITQTPMATLSGSVQGTLGPVAARLDFYGEGDPNGLTASVVAQVNGDYSVSLPSKERYRVVASFPSPYVDRIETTGMYLPTGGATLSFFPEPAEVLLVDDDGGATLHTSYQSSVARLNFRYRTFGVADSGAALPAVLAAFVQKPLVIWFTGSDTTNALTAAERRIIIDHLNRGGRAIMTGQNIAQFTAPGDSLLQHYLGIQYNGNSTAISLRGFAGDVIGNGVNYLITGGPGPQTSKDILALAGGSLGTPTPTLYYAVGSDSSLFAGVRVVGPGSSWGATFFGFGLDGLNPARQDTFIIRSIRFFNSIPTEVQAPDNVIPQEYTMEQNYPNPFNPITHIRYGLPEASRVTITVFNSIGQRVAELVHGDQSAGFHAVTWNSMSQSHGSLSSGIYFVRLEATGTSGRNFARTQKLVLLK